MRRVNLDMEVMNNLRSAAISLGAEKAEIVSVNNIKTDPSFRALCEANVCGNYGRSYMCPPNIDTVDKLIQQLYTYKSALVYQTVSQLDDSFDFVGMMRAGKKQNKLGQQLWDITDKFGLKALHLGAGGCRLCETCACCTMEPCRHPARAMASLEAYGVDVSALAVLAGMQYTNGQNTVTYFGAIFI